MTTQFERETLGDIVSNNYQAAAIFERYGLAFCCDGRRSLADACRQRGVDLQPVIADLETLQATEAGTPSDDPAELVTYIVVQHHAYVRYAIPIIQAHLITVVAVHGQRHPELAAVAGHFDVVANELLLHMAKEEQVLFPYIRALAKAGTHSGPPPPDIFGTVQNPIRMMEIEHQDVGDELAMIRDLSSGFTPPGDACSTYRAAYEELRAFERDLHRHIHLENNVLFPRAVELEAQTARNGRIGCETARQTSEDEV